MNVLQRQQLVWLEAAAWPGVLARSTRDSTDEATLACLRHWAEADLPLVVTRQPAAAIGCPADDAIALGLPAPARWQRRRIHVVGTCAAIRRIGAFPRADAIVEMLPIQARADWRSFCAALDGLRVTARMYGSYGWQSITGLDYLHPQSDLDVLLELAAPGQAACASALLNDLPQHLPRVDGEFLFGDGAATPWREWSAWHAGHIDRILVKRLRGVSLERPSRASMTL